MCANLPVIDLYRPMVSSAFLYFVISYAFKGIGHGQKELYTLDYALSFVQLCLTVIHFHVSWYSKRCGCWDKVGWYFMAVSTVVVRAVIPVVSIIISFHNMTKKKGGTDTYNLLQMSHSLTILFSAIQFGFFAKR